LSIEAAVWAQARRFTDAVNEIAKDIVGRRD
jgi:hypothetical protein